MQRLPHISLKKVLGMPADDVVGQIQPKQDEFQPIQSERMHDPVVAS
jgi:hypothetical protein